MSTKVLCSVVGKRYKQTRLNSGESNFDGETQRNCVRGETTEKKLKGFLTLKRLRGDMNTLFKYLKEIPSFIHVCLCKLSDPQTQGMVNKLQHIPILDYLKPYFSHVRCSSENSVRSQSSIPISHLSVFTSTHGKTCKKRYRMLTVTVSAG